MFPLFRSQLLGQLDVDGRVQITTLLRLAHRRHSVTLQPEHLRLLRGGRNPEAERLSGECRDVDFTPEDGRRQRDRDRQR